MVRLRGKRTWSIETTARTHDLVVPFGGPTQQLVRPSYTDARTVRWSLLSPRDVIDNAYAVAASDLVAMLGASIGDRLPADEVKRRHNVFGPNTIVSQRKANLLVLLFHQFQSPVVYLLSVAAALALYLGELEKAGAIAVVLVLNTLIGLLTELKAARSIEALRALGTHSARVRCDGHMRLIPAEQIVPGDIVVLEAGELQLRRFAAC